MATDTRPLPNDQALDSRDFRVAGISLISSSGLSKDISALVQEIQLRQDMFLSYISGEMLILDAVDMHTQLALHGGEYIYIHITEPGKTLSINKAFRVYKIGNRMQSNDGSQRYVLYFTSEEMFESSTMKISKAYKDTTVSDVATSILTKNLKIPSKRVFVEPTTDSMNIVLPYLRPTEALHWLASRAYTSTAAGFMFFENLDGFHFRSLASLYKEPNAIKVPYVLESKRGQKALDMDKYAIDEYEARKDFDSLSTLASGGFAMQLTAIDFTNQDFTNTAYSLNSLPTMLPNKSMTNGGQVLDRYRSHYLTYVKSKGIENWITRTMHLAQLSNSLTEITVPGNLRLQAGKCMSLRVPYIIPPSDSDMWDKRKSGRYLIAAVNHKFDMLNHRFNSLLLLTRDSVPEALPSADESITEKVRKINANANLD